MSAVGLCLSLTEVLLAGTLCSVLLSNLSGCESTVLSAVRARAVGEREDGALESMTLALCTIYSL